MSKSIFEEFQDLKKRMPKKGNTFPSSPLDISVKRNPNYFRPKHQIYLNKQIIKIHKSKSKNNLAISMPPRTGKSELTIVSHACWLIGEFWDIYPIKIAIVTYSTDFSSRHLRAIRAFFQEFYPEMLGEKWTQTELEFANGSSLLATSPTSQLVGREINYLLIDDIIKSAEEAYSPAYQRRVQEFWEASALTRMQKFPIGDDKFQAPKIFITATLWSPTDLIYRIPNEDPKNWTVVRLSAICDNPKTDPLKRRLNESIFPELFTTKEFREKQAAVGSVVWNNQYMSEAIGKTGLVLDPENIVHIKIQDPLAERFTCLACDPSLGESGSKGDDTALFVTTALKDGRYYIKHFEYGKWQVPEILNRMSRLYYLYKPEITALEGIGAFRLIGNDLNAIGIPTKIIKSVGNKASRLMNLVPVTEQGLLLMNPDIDPYSIKYFEDQLLKWSPDNRNAKDDLLDALEHSLSQLGYGGGGDFYSMDGDPRYYEGTPGWKKQLNPKSAFAPQNKRRKNVYMGNNPYSIRRR
jgi:predicted phage terminase large subunit-like protein